MDVRSGRPAARAGISTGYIKIPRLAARLRAESGVPVAAVGRITEPEQAEQLLASGGADAVFLARALLRDLSWANNAAASLGEPRRLILPYGRG